jgi:hypothetical protein
VYKKTYPYPICIVALELVNVYKKTFISIWRFKVINSFSRSRKREPEKLLAIILRFLLKEENFKNQYPFLTGVIKEEREREKGNDTTANVLTDVVRNPFTQEMGKPRPLCFLYRLSLG